MYILENMVNFVLEITLKIVDIFLTARNCDTDSKHFPIHVVLRMSWSDRTGLDVRFRCIAQQDKCALISFCTRIWYTSLGEGQKISHSTQCFGPSGAGPHYTRSEVTKGYVAYAT